MTGVYKRVNKTSLNQEENLSFAISHQLLPQAHQRLDLYFSIPVEMGINPYTLSEENFFHSSINTRSAYYSDQLHLPLVRSRFISKQKGEQTDYRVNLNLFSYQIRIALKTDIKQTLLIKDADEFYTKADEIVEQITSLLKKLRRYTPPDKKLSSFFENADNYLSWNVEQSFLKLLTNGPKSTEHAEVREKLFEVCRNENAYRTTNQYNSATTIDDPNRISNKMRLLQRLIEYGVVFKKENRKLNINYKKVVRGLVTAVIMAFVMMLILRARSTFTEITLLLVSFLGFIYGLREIFKDDITTLIWNYLKKGRPKWQNIFTNSATQTKIAVQTIWLEYISKKDLPEQVNKLFQSRRQQNKQAAQLLHFRSDTKVLVKDFMPGYDEIQEQILFSLAPFVRYLKKGDGKLYNFEGNKISKQAVERRYQINLVMVQTNKDNKQELQRYKVTLNRSGIINIEGIKTK